MRSISDEHTIICVACDKRVAVTCPHEPKFESRGWGNPYMEMAREAGWFFLYEPTRVPDCAEDTNPPMLLCSWGCVSRYSEDRIVLE